MRLGVVTGSRDRLALSGAWLAVTVFATGQFVFQTAAVGLSAGAVAALCALAAALGLVFAGGSVRGGSLSAIRPAQASAAALTGALAFAGAPLLAMSNRFSDAPAGSLALFWTVPFAGAVLVAGATALSREGTGWRRSAAALVGLTGAAGVLANWERPSSFSLLARHIPQQLALAGTALLWAAGVLILAGMSRRYGRARTFRWAALGALVGGVALAVADAASVREVLGSAFWIPLAVMVLGATWSILGNPSSHPEMLAGSALLVVPTFLTLFTFVEAAIGALGPRPVLLGPVAAASALVAIGVAGVLANGTPTRRAGIGARLLAAAAVASAVAALVLPGVSVAARGLRGDMQEFSADFALAGVETVGGWIVVALALFLLTETLSRRGIAVSQAVLSVGMVVVAVAAWLVLRYVPLHTWVTWIPAEVQQDYGTEYASITFSAVAVYAQMASLVASAACAALISVDIARRWQGLSKGSDE